MMLQLIAGHDLLDGDAMSLFGDHVESLSALKALAGKYIFELDDVALSKRVNEFVLHLPELACI